jgi:hypothetical protein
LRRPRRRELPAASTIVATSAWSARAGAQHSAARVTTHGLDLGDDRERDLLGGLGADVEPDRRVQP